MKKKIFSISASLLLLTMLVIPADATNVDVTDPDAMLPVDIILDQDNREIRKVYDLSPNTDPSSLKGMASSMNAQMCCVRSSSAAKRR